jgi:two-component system response regulator HydG
VIDDNMDRRAAIVRTLQGSGYKVLIGTGVLRTSEALGRTDIDIAICGLQCSGADGLSLLNRIKALSRDIEVILVTASGTIEVAVEAIKSGAYDYIVSPSKRMTFLLRIVERAAERQRLTRAFRAGSSHSAGGPVYASSRMRDIMHTVEQVGGSVATVLISGESGTGKEVVADAIHAASPRRDRPLIKLSCAALPDSLLESELFGHERGAFTGARSEKAGRFEMANGGTLFLDEIGEISPSTQVKLLRVLQNGQFERLGGTRTIQSDVRIVAATNRDLQREIAEQRFRVDLFYRLNVVDIQLPPLRSRKEDIPPLATYFLNLYAEKNGKRITGFSEDAMRALISHDWPGNVRELENTIERAVVFTNEGEVPLSVLPQAETLSPDSRPTLTFKVGMRLGDLERQAIKSALEHSRGNKPMAARLLGVGLRTIYRHFDMKKRQVDEPCPPEFRELEALAAVPAFAASAASAE